MKLLFTQGGSRLKLSDKGLWYTDPNFTPEVWKRYLSVCDHLTIILRKENIIYDDGFAKSKFNLVPSQIEVIALDDLLVPKYNIFNYNKWAEIKKIYSEQVSKADKIIIRAESIYSKICFDECIKQQKKYLYEVVGFAYESLSYHSLLGKLSANYFESLAKKIAYNAAASIYVTEEALQKRYPSKVMMGCSDVELDNANDDVLINRINKVRSSNVGKKIIIGTAAFLDVKWKGQSLVIEALKELQDRGYNNVYYELVGVGKGDEIKKLANKLGVSDKVVILGAKPHKEIFSWLDHIDLYVQPSYQEGLCRIIVEAMSRACPVVCSNTGGNNELISKDYLTECGNVSDIVLKIENIFQDMEKQARDNFEKSKKFDKQILNKKRFDFLKSFVDDMF